MLSRNTVITIVPLAIVGLFGMIGVISSRSGERQQRVDLPLAISEPVQAKWDASTQTTTFTLDIAEPRTNQARSLELMRERILLDHQRDVRIGPSTSRSPDFGVLVNNDAKAERVEINGLRASECTEYGGYLGDAADWWIRNTTLHQRDGATQHGLRIASGTRIRISDTLIDARGGDKTTLWVLNGEDIELRNVKLAGGRSWFSIDPNNPDLPNGRVRNVIIADCWIDCDQDWPNAMEFMPGVDGVTITNLHVRAAKPPIGVWSDVGGVQGARNVRWKDIWVPAPGQPPDRAFDDLEWVRLRDDDWDRIVTHRGQSRAQAIANGIGPLTSQ